MNPELIEYEALGKEIIRRCMAEEEPDEIYRWLTERLIRVGGGDPSAILTWPESFTFTDRMLENYERIANTPEAERKILSWPWASWNKLIDPLEEGMLGVVTAPDGQGKTMYAEAMAEHWAEHKQRVVFVHYELNKKLMMLRRTARHTGLTVRQLKSGRLTDAEKSLVAEIRPRLIAWDGYITYVHTPGWTMERTIAELRRLSADKECDVVLLDYLEKAAISGRQGKYYSASEFQREADNVEQLKTFAEQTEKPVVMIAQMNKESKGQSFNKVDRTGLRGAGEKSDKANLVVLLKRDRIAEGYSNTVNVLVDKNTMGGTGTFQQIMQPEYFRIGDIYQEPSGMNATSAQRVKR